MRRSIRLLAVVVLGMTFFQVAPTLHAEPKNVGSVKVFLLAGQSNMNGRGNIRVLEDKLIKDHPDKYPPSLMKMRDDVWISGANGFGISDQKTNLRLEPGFGQWKWFGPELGFGHAMGDYFDEQVLIIKIFGGGTSLAEVWCSPTAAQRTGRPVGDGYKKILRQTTAALNSLDQHFEGYDAQQGYQIMGFFWVHGNADGGRFAKEYEDNLTDFITDVRTCLGLPDLPVVVAESLSSRAPGSAFGNAADRVNETDGNQQTKAILTKSRIDLKGDDYAPYKGAGDGTHWLHNPRAYLDVGYWAAELMKPKLAAGANHAEDVKIQQAWKEHLATFEKESDE